MKSKIEQRYCRCEYKNIYLKKITLNPATCNCKNGTYLGSITDDSVITCGEIIEEIKTLPTNFNEKKKQPAKHKICIFYLPFLLITIALLIAVSIDCYLIKHWAKQKHFLPFHVKNNTLIEIMY